MHMANNSSEPTPRPAGGLQSMLARLRGIVQARKPPLDDGRAPEEVLPTFDVPDGVAPPLPAPTDAVPLALPVQDGSPPEAPLAEPVAEAASGPAAVAESPVRVAPAGTPRQLCPYCHAPRSSSDSYCGNCGWVFSAEETVFLGPASANSSGAGEQIQGRYELGALVNERQGVARFRGLDPSTDVKPPLPVVILRSRRDEPPPAAQAPAQSDSDDGDVLPDFEEPMAATVPMSQIGISPNLIWPTLLWEEAILRKAEHSALPRVLES